MEATHHPTPKTGKRKPIRTACNDLEAALESWVVELPGCSLDQGTVRLAGNELVCEECGRRYPMRAGIACRLPDQARSEQKF
jgi:uncharacterized protein YbaR (Trm112 family)